MRVVDIELYKVGGKWTFSIPEFNDLGPIYHLRRDALAEAKRRTRDYAYSLTDAAKRNTGESDTAAHSLTSEVA